MKNYLCFLPSIDEGGHKKTFFFFEHLHNGTYKSDQIGTTDRAVGLIKCALSESTRNIAIDTSTHSGRNLLNRVLPFTQEQGADRLFLASLFQRHYVNIQNYWHEWGKLPLEERKTQDNRFMNLFGAVRTLGGIRPLTALDRLSIQAWQTEYEQIDSPFTDELLKHPVAMYLLSVVQAIKERRRRVPDRTGFSSEEMIAGITHNLCHLVQDPFPLDDSENLYVRPCLRLFQIIPLEQERHPLLTKSPEDIVYNVVRGEGKDKDILKKYNNSLWSLIVCTRKLLDNLLGGVVSRNGADVSGIFRKSCVFERRILMLFDQMLNVWTEALMPGYHNASLDFVDHEIFSKNLAPIVLEKCKEFLDR
jgi:hypothetical protein